ncbi:MAG: heme exporter protein CcmB, partial [Deltaproteobacteria bacterium]|nr:heme exporter protein CcmB [Deltaproteobacteria bacterium]
VGTLFSAIAVNTRSREVMLPILLLPVAAPVLIAAVEATAVIMDGGTLSQIGRWWQILVAFDVIFLTVGFLIFEWVIEA